MRRIRPGQRALGVVAHRNLLVGLAGLTGHVTPMGPATPKASPSSQGDLWPISVSDWAGIAAAVIAFGALVVALLSFLTSRKALRLSEREEERRALRLKVQIQESGSLRPGGADYRLLACSLVVTNPAASANAVAMADLHLTYETSDGVVTTAKVPHAERVTDAAAARLTPLAIPAPVEKNSAIKGWILFRVDDGLLGGAPVDRYDLVIKDVHEVTESIQIPIFRDIDG